MTFQVQIIDNGTVIYSFDVDRPLELGRQQQGEPQPLSMVESDRIARLIVATLDDVSIGRRQLLVEPQANGAVRLTNLSDKVSLQIRGGAALEKSGLTSWQCRFPYVCRPHVLRRSARSPRNPNLKALPLRRLPLGEEASLQKSSELNRPENQMMTRNNLSGNCKRRWTCFKAHALSRHCMTRH